VHDKGFPVGTVVSPVKPGESESDHGPQSKGVPGRVPS